MGYLDGMALSGLDGLESPTATDQAAVDSTQTGKDWMKDVCSNPP